MEFGIIIGWFVLSVLFNSFVFNRETGEERILISGTTTTSNWMISALAAIVTIVIFFYVYTSFGYDGVIIGLIILAWILFAKKYKNNKQDYCDR